MPSAAEAEEKHSPDTTLFAVQRLGERKDLGEIIKLGLIFSSLAICVPICVESDDTLKKGWQSQDQHKNWSQHQTRNPGSLHPKSQFHPIPHVARDAITCSPTGARTSQTGDVLCRGGVTAGTASDLLCTASMGQRQQRLEGTQGKEAGQELQAKSLLGAVQNSTREPSPKVWTPFQEGKACRTRTSRDLQPLTPHGCPERQLVLSPGDATGRDRQGQVTAGLGVKLEGPLLK